MFNNVSMTGVGGIITIVELLAHYFGLELPEGSIAAAVNGIVAFVGVLWLIWGQLRRKDLIGGIVKK